VDDMNFDVVESQLEAERGIRISSHVLINNIYVSVLEVHAIEINNNTAVQCAVYSGNALSDRVFLRIQGKYYY
jgi:hypothetical protein